MLFLTLRSFRSTLGLISSTCKTTLSYYSTSAPPPEAPGTCCMSGCANCVWLDYAEEVTKYYEMKGGDLPKDEIIKEIESQMSDPMVKAFVLLEIKSKFR